MKFRFAKISFEVGFTSNKFKIKTALNLALKSV